MNSSEDSLVSVIVAVKNGGKFIRSALKSIYNQDHRPIEIIVVDGNSQDDTRSIVRQFDDIRLVTQKGSGISDAYNTGIKEATASFVAFLSSDDLWMPGKLSAQISYMTEHSKILYTNTLIEYFLEPDTIAPKGFRKELLIGSHPAKIMETLVARKEVFEKVGLFNQDLSTAEDVDWYSRASDLNIPSFMIDKVLLKKRIHGHNILMKWLEEITLFVRRHGENMTEGKNLIELNRLKTIKRAIDRNREFEE